FEKFDKGTAWFVVAFMASGLLIYYGFANGAWSFSLAIIAAMIAYGVHLKQKPRKVKIKISKMGITLGKIKVPFSHMRTFWITYHPPFMKTLTIRTTDVWLSDLTIQLEDQDPVEIREFLVKQIPEWEGKQIGFFDSLARFFKL
ncbi:hypothetical protein KKG51_01780, partial [Patescibacteria group bacterium]|nr:hypothetical protein [Patescibacteria group bacterium]